MTKFKYHSKGIGKNRAIREQRKKPLPLSLMTMKEIEELANKTVVIAIFKGAYEPQRP